MPSASMRTTARNEHERKLVNAYTSPFSGEMLGPLPWVRFNPRMQRLMQEGYERRRAKEQGRFVPPLPVEKG